MVSNVFDVILEELSQKLKINNLTPDSNNSCLIKLANGCEVQMEPDKTGENIVMGSVIAPIPSGGFQVSVLKEALKANAQPPPKAGIFAWSDKAGSLIIFTTLAMRNLTGDKVADALYLLTATSMKWHEMISAGTVPVVESLKPTTAARGTPFGIRP